MQIMAPLAPAIVVVTDTRDPVVRESCPAWPVKKLEPMLKPYHPIHKMETPSEHNRSLEPLSLARTSSSSLKNPNLGLKITVPTRPATPPTVCTTEAPAKSMKPFSFRYGSSRRGDSHPSSDQTQCATTG
mmetsp:Transcript_17600/g.33487  ORF Transcript_17600/g.33487 Transcript_17600/m.33487 type:complete len:130 (-) Transcript_17600:540-929(-)